MKRLLPAWIAAFVVASATLVQGQTVEFFMTNGQELLRRGVFSQAVNAFQHALAIEPDYFEAQYDLGLTYLQWGKNPEAVTELRKALRLQPRNALVWSSIAVAFDNQNQGALSQEALTQAVSCDPGNATVRMNLAALYANAKRYAEAAAQYREAVKLEGSNTDALINLSRCLVILGSVAEAKGCLEAAAVARPDKGEASSELGDLYLKQMHDTGRAIGEYQTAIEVERNNPNYYQQLAWAFDCRGDVGNALAAWKMALLYSDDPLKKSAIRERIDQLERGEHPGGRTDPAERNASALSRQKTRDLEQEVRPENASRETRRIDAQPVDIARDLEQINADTASNRWDISKQLNKNTSTRKQ